MAMTMNSDDEYTLGYLAGLAWLRTRDGLTYLGPDDAAALVVELPHDPARNTPGDVMAGPYNQAVSDAVKHADWHRQRPGDVCAEGEGCLTAAWLGTFWPPQAAD